MKKVRMISLGAILIFIIFFVFNNSPIIQFSRNLFQPVTQIEHFFDVITYNGVNGNADCYVINGTQDSGTSCRNLTSSDNIAWNITNATASGIKTIFTDEFADLTAWNSTWGTWAATASCGVAGSGDNCARHSGNQNGVGHYMNKTINISGYTNVNYSVFINSNALDSG